MPTELGPPMVLEASDRREFCIGAALFALVAATWWYGLTVAPADEHQGEVYRIIYLHVPSAMAAFLAALVLLIFSIIGLRSKDEQALIYQKSSAEVGLFFTALALATGSIWGKPTWGTWWTWDARLTTTFLLALLYAGFLLLHSALSPGRQRVTVCSVLGIVIFADVPIIYKSVTWWRTLHQPPSILRAGGSTMHPEILYPLLTSITALALLGFWLGWQRAKNLQLAGDLETASFAAPTPKNLGGR